MNSASGVSGGRKGLPWLQYAQHLAGTASHSSGKLPDFLVVAPAKTGTTWLFHVLSRHPQVYIPPIKEVRYFDLHWQKNDIGWYQAQFQAGEGRVAGDISPSYSLLPSFVIEHIKRLKPDLRLIFLFREPIARAWSHARHAFMAYEANFWDAAGTIEEVPAERFEETFVDDNQLSSGDYAEILERWLAHFDARQIHVEFIENIDTDPKSCLSGICRFLGVETSFVDTLPVHDRIHVGAERPLSDESRAMLHALYDARRARFEDVMTRVFSREVPWPTRRKRMSSVFTLAECPDQTSIVLYDGKFYRIPTATKYMAMTSIAGARRTPAGDPGYPSAQFLGDLLTEGGGDDGSLATRSEADRRLVRVLDDLAQRSEVQDRNIPVLQGTQSGFDIYRWREYWVASPAGAEGLHTNGGPAAVLRLYEQIGAISDVSLEHLQSRLAERKHA